MKTELQATIEQQNSGREFYADFTYYVEISQQWASREKHNVLLTKLGDDPEEATEYMKTRSLETERL